MSSVVIAGVDLHHFTMRAVAELLEDDEPNLLYEEYVWRGPVADRLRGGDKGEWWMICGPMGALRFALVLLFTVGYVTWQVLVLLPYHAVKSCLCGGEAREQAKAFFVHALICVPPYDATVWHELASPLLGALVLPIAAASVTSARLGTVRPSREQTMVQGVKVIDYQVQRGQGKLLVYYHKETLDVPTAVHLVRKGDVLCVDGDVVRVLNSCLHRTHGGDGGNTVSGCSGCGSGVGDGVVVTSHTVRIGQPGDVVTA